MGEPIEQENHNDEPTHKKGRHRKRQLYNSILQQMEFYFSDSNLSKDRFLQQLIKENPHVDLNVFLKFNKLRKLTTDIEDIRKAVKNSKLIELTEDKNHIFRKVPLKEKTNVDDCTIYVERLKADATHEWLSSVFSEFGNVVYVSIPKYRHNSAIKGFAFVEFDTEKEAQNALSYFESIGCKMPSNIEPEQLCSIATFEETSEKNIETKGNLKKLNTVQSASENIGKEEKPELESKNEKEIDSEENVKKRKLDEIQDDNENEKEKRQKLESEELSESEDSENKKKKKLKKEHKKKNYIKELGLHVLSKKEWKKMRNRYLELQRKKMKEFKKHLLKAKYSQANYDDKFKKPNENSEQNKVEKPEEPSKPLEYVQGVIVKIKLNEPCADPKKFKNELKSSCNEVKYVDLPNPGSEDIYVRFANNSSAKNFCKQDSADSRTILEGDEENDYWERLMKNRKDKLRKENKKQRGRDKLLKKAKQVMAKHIKFDE